MALRIVSGLVVVLLSAGALAQADAERLAPPTSRRYADRALYEVVSVRLLEAPTLSLEIELGAIDPSGGLVVGITQPIIEVYLDAAPGGAPALLPGSSLLMPDGDGWEVALRITGDGAWAWVADEVGATDLARPLAVEATASGRLLEVRTSLPPAPTARVYAITGVYDPFRPDGWRPVAREPSPWAFSSEAPAFPVVDLYPAEGPARARAFELGTLPRAATFSVDLGSSPWLTLMLVGLTVAVVGVGWRRWAPRREATTPSREDEPFMVGAVPTAQEASASLAVEPSTLSPRTPGRRKGHVTLELLIDDDDAAAALPGAREGSAPDTPVLAVVPVPMAALPAPRPEDGVG